MMCDVKIFDQLFLTQKFNMLILCGAKFSVSVAKVASKSLHFGVALPLEK